MLPVRWMAPESLGLGVFSPASDIWSYGVLLYEIVTFGSFPFQGMSNNQVLDHVKTGKTLQIPKKVKPHLEGLISSCWATDPKRRPPASEIVVFLANHPKLITPCLDVPLSSVQIEHSEDQLPAQAAPPPSMTSLMNGDVTAPLEGYVDLSAANQTTRVWPNPTDSPTAPLLPTPTSNGRVVGGGPGVDSRYIPMRQVITREDDYIPRDDNNLSDNDSHL